VDKDTELRWVVAVSEERSHTHTHTAREEEEEEEENTMAKRALLVGCNYPGTKCELHGCANDVKRMRTTLVERFGFDESDILVMLDTDPSTPQPTGANIRSSLKKLINSVEPGDVLVFHYSGHGTQVSTTILILSQDILQIFLEHNGRHGNGNCSDFF
jgi:uncharacterized caspase-like protein